MIGSVYGPAPVVGQVILALPAAGCMLVVCVLCNPGNSCCVCAPVLLLSLPAAGCHLGLLLALLLLPAPYAEIGGDGGLASFGLVVVKLLCSCFASRIVRAVAGCCAVSALPAVGCRLAVCLVRVRAGANGAEY